MDKRTETRTNKIKIALIGTRGIPPKYGGAETFVYELSKRLKNYFDVYVTCETDHFGIDEFEDIKRVHVWAKHTPTLTIPVIYDIVETLYLLLEIKDLRIFYYVPVDGAIAGIIAKLAGRKILVNTDGLEWKRLFIRMRFAPWYMKPLYLFTGVMLLISEFLACKIPDITVADSIAIKKYLEYRWRPRRVEYVAYGVRKLPTVDKQTEQEILKQYHLEPCGYYLTISRIVAENGIHVEIEAVKKSRTTRKLVIVGPIDPRDPYVRYLFKLIGRDKRIVLTGGIYDPRTLYVLRKNCFAYIHPYEVGGTNPSLLEQLQFNKPIIAYDMPFHREVLRDRSIYFRSREELKEIIEKLERRNVSHATFNIPYIFTWEWVAWRYKNIFRKLIKPE